MHAFTYVVNEAITRSEVLRIPESYHRVVDERLGVCHKENSQSKAEKSDGDEPCLILGDDH